METRKRFRGHLWNFLAFFPIFVLLITLGIIKAALVGPFVFLLVSFGNSAVIIGLWPLHAIWTYYCIGKTRKFGIFMKFLLLLIFIIPLSLWLLIGILGSMLTGFGYGFFWPLMATFEAIAEGVENKFVSCFKDGTWDTILGGCTIVRDFTDVSFHSYFSVMDSLLESRSETPIEIKVTLLPTCILAGILGVLIDVPIISIIVIYKAPMMLLRGWQRLVQDLIGSEGPFLETVCVPFAGLSILLWPAAVCLSTLAGIISSFFLGCYAAAVAYQESSTKQGVLYAFAMVSMFDEYTNDLLCLREGSCFPRPEYHKTVGSSQLPFPIKTPEKPAAAQTKKHPVQGPYKKLMALKPVVIWDNFFQACEHTGKELIRDGAIGMQDLEAWKHSKNQIVNNGIPAYVFLLCFLRSIKSGFEGFLMRDNVELTSANRPEGRVFDWMFEPMSSMKEQIKSLMLLESEELYLHKLTLYCSDMKRIEAWKNGGVPPNDESRSAQLQAISRRLHGFCLAISRLPTFRRRYHDVVKALVQAAKQRSESTDLAGSSEDIEVAL
ncbi:uncharacterized membrane protein At3g27390-like isoform X2 [Macadamia integrifolia]|uniref:uncharacterized membrane protein At3g27390-like isoform X2 n=1 Tax=Macadamia integrifolia TaxID=60698 RepID=UPI001C4F1EC0|nr:uncharacterized membrane protein At3g27390-like isoform X2 [Macadamia integrifolia]